MFSDTERLRVATADGPSGVTLRTSHLPVVTLLSPLGYHGQKIKTHRNRTATIFRVPATLASLYNFSAPNEKRPQ